MEIQKKKKKLKDVGHQPTSFSIKTNPKQCFTKNKEFGFAPFGGAEHAISEHEIVAVFCPETLNVSTILLPLSPSS